MSFIGRVRALRGVFLVVALGLALWLGLRERQWAGAALLVYLGVDRSRLLVALWARRSLRAMQPYRDERFELAHPVGWTATAQERGGGVRELELDGSGALIKLLHFPSRQDRDALLEHWVATIEARMTIRERSEVVLDVGGHELEGLQLAASTWREAAVFEAVAGPAPDGGTLHAITYREVALPADLVRLPLARMQLHVA